MEAMPPMIPTNKANMSEFNPPCQWNPIRTATIKSMTTCTPAMRDHGKVDKIHSYLPYLLESLEASWQ